MKGVTYNSIITAIARIKSVVFGVTSDSHETRLGICVVTTYLLV